MFFNHSLERENQKRVRALDISLPVNLQNVLVYDQNITEEI